MLLDFDLGDAASPRGHAIVYFQSGATLLATYVLVLPIAMDMGKYLPPLLASQLGGLAGAMTGGDMSSFAVPPVPEQVESVGVLEKIALARGDDLIHGGSVVVGDMAAAMAEVGEVVEEYRRLYQENMSPLDAEVSGPTGDRSLREDQGRADSDSRVDHVLYELMNERDRLGELSKLVGTMRFAIERNDNTLVDETDASMAALERLLPEPYWAAKVRVAAKDLSENGVMLVRLYVDRCYKLLEEDFAAVELLERRIGDFADDSRSG